jgi:hypothetical protein
LSIQRRCPREPSFSAWPLTVGRLGSTFGRSRQPVASVTSDRVRGSQGQPARGGVIGAVRNPQPCVWRHVAFFRLQNQCIAGRPPERLSSTQRGQTSDEGVGRHHSAVNPSVIARPASRTLPVGKNDEGDAATFNCISLSVEISTSISVYCRGVRRYTDA